MEAERMIMLDHRRRTATPDDGFTLIEAVVSLVIAALMFMALAAGVAQALRSTLFARQNQHAADLLTQYVELTRGYSYDSIAMSTADSDFTTDTCGGTVVWPCAAGTGAARTFDPDGPSGPLPAEPVYAIAGAAVVPHVVNDATTVRNGTQYNIRRYITQPVTIGSRRLVVVLSWTINGQPHTRVTSTLIADTRRGLPLPKYTWAWNTIVSSVARGTTLNLGATLTNRGATDRWNLQATAKTPGGATLPWTWTWYRDDNGDGIWEPATETVRLDTDHNGTWDSGLLQTDEPMKVVAVTEVAPNETVQVDTVSLSATSASQPNVAAQPDITRTISVQGFCVCVFRQFYLRNAAEVGNVMVSNVNAEPATGNPLNTNAPTALSLFDYDQDIDNPPAPGRTLLPGGTGPGETNKRLSVNWQYPVSTTTTFGGTALLNIDAVPASLLADDPGSLVLYVRAQQVGVPGWSTIATQTYTTPSWGTSSLRSINLPIALPPFVVAAGSRVEIILEVPAASGAMRLGYDTAGYNGLLQLPYTLGSP
jgi:Tfp pilus assembly protein PilV